MTFEQLTQPLDPSPVDITITFDLAAMRADASLKALLGGDGYLDPTKLLNVQAILAYTGQVF